MSTYKLVPTDGMVKAGNKALAKFQFYLGNDEMLEVCQEILAAAPAQEVEPVAWAILAKNGKVRIWWNNKESALLRVSSNGNDYDQLDEGERFVELYLSPPTAEQAAADMKRTLIAIRQCFADAPIGKKSTRLQINEAREIINRALESLPTSDTAMEEMRRDAERFRWLESNAFLEELDMDSQSIDEQIAIDATFESLDAIAAENSQTEPKVTGSEKQEAMNADWSDIKLGGVD